MNHIGLEFKKENNFKELLYSHQSWRMCKIKNCNLKYLYHVWASLLLSSAWNRTLKTRHLKFFFFSFWIIWFAYLDIMFLEWRCSIVRSIFSTHYTLNQRRYLLALHQANNDTIFKWELPRAASRPGSSGLIVAGYSSGGGGGRGSWKYTGLL